MRASKGSSWKSFDNNWYTVGAINWVSNPNRNISKRRNISLLRFSCLHCGHEKVIFTLSEAFSSFTLLYACTQAPLYLRSAHIWCFVWYSRAPSNQNANIQILKQIKSVTEKRKEKERASSQSSRAILQRWPWETFSKNCNLKNFWAFVVLRCVLLCLIVWVCV